MRYQESKGDDDHVFYVTFACMDEQQQACKLFVWLLAHLSKKLKLTKMYILKKCNMYFYKLYFSQSWYIVIECNINQMLWNMSNVQWLILTNLDGKNRSVQNDFYTDILSNYDYYAALVRDDIVPDIFS